MSCSCTTCFHSHSVSLEASNVVSCGYSPLLVADPAAPLLLGWSVGPFPGKTGVEPKSDSLTFSSILSNTVVISGCVAVIYISFCFSSLGFASISVPSSRFSCSAISISCSRAYFSKYYYAASISPRSHCSLGAFIISAILIPIFVASSNRS